MKLNSTSADRHENDAHPTPQERSIILTTLLPVGIKARILISLGCSHALRNDTRIGVSATGSRHWVHGPDNIFGANATEIFWSGARLSTTGKLCANPPTGRAVGHRANLSVARDVHNFTVGRAALGFGLPGPPTLKAFSASEVTL